MRVTFGRKVPRGHLPVFTTNTVEEAKQLIVMTCPIDVEGHYYARELAEEQTLENLQKFSDKLQAAWEHLKGGKL